MRYVAFLFLLILSLYFIFLKPYLISKRIFYRVEGISLRLSPPSLNLSNFYVYLPSRGRYLFLSLKDLSLVYDGRLKLYLREGIFNSVGETSTEEARSVPRLYVPEFVKEAEISVGSFLITFVGEKATAVLLRDLKLKNRRLIGRAEVLSGRLTSHVTLDGAFLGERRIFVERARVWSDMFDFEVRGSLNESDLRAGFSFEGKVERVHRGPVRVEPVRVEGRGTLDYKGLSAKFEGVTEEVEVEKRLSLREVRTVSELRVEFGRTAYLKGRIWNDLTSWNYRFELLPEKILEAETDSFPVDSDLLGVPYLVFAWVGGRVLYRIDKGRLNLSLSTDNLSVEGFRFGRGGLDLDYDLRKGEGKISLTASRPGYLSLMGSFQKGRFEGDIEVRNLFFAEGEASTCISYVGKVGYEGKLILKGAGEFRDLSYGRISVGSGNYRLDLEGENLNLEYGGEGFSGYLKGNLRKGLISITELRGLSREISGVDLEVREGRVEFSSSEGSFALGVEISEGRLKRDRIESSFSGRLRLTKVKVLEGNYLLHLKGIKVGSKDLPDTMFEGSIRGDVSGGTFGAGEVLRGSYTFNVGRKLLKANGRLSLENLKLGFSFVGTPERGGLEWGAEILYLGKLVRLSGRGSYRGESFLFSVNPTEYDSGTFKVSFGGLDIAGDLDDASLNLKEIKASILDKPVVELLQRRGRLYLRKGKLEWEGEFKGALEGEAELSYSKGFSLTSKGVVDLERLSFFTATPIGGKAKGKLAYSLLYRDGNLDLEVRNAGRVVTYSRFFSFPLEAWVDLKALDRSLAAFVTLWKEDTGLSANVGSLNLKDYYVYLISRELPLLYRDDNFLLSLRVSSEGWVNVKDLREVDLRLDALFNGDIEIKKLGKKGGRRSKAIPVKLDVRFESDRPVKLMLPEGYIYANVRGWVAGSSTDPKYSVEVELLSGELKYFGRTFFVKGGVISSVKEAEGESTSLDVTLVSPSDDISIFLNVRGDAEDPRLIVWSEPPRSTRELLTKLIIGSTAEGVIPVAKALFKQLGYVGNVRSGLANLLGVEISFSTQTGSQGEVGFGVNVRKKIARAFSIEYQQSTLKDPRATYYGGSVSLTRGFSFYGRVFSDKTSELKLRFIRKFDF